jgi:hypothetical protein
VDLSNLVDDFRSDRESGKRPSSREKKYDELRDGMSVFGSLDAARERWQDLKQLADERGEAVRAGYYIAEVVLGSDGDFSIEDLDEVDEHLTIWGSPEALVVAVSRIYPGATETE